MSARDPGSASPSIGFGTPHHSISELIDDREGLKRFADAADISRRNIREDGCGQWTISGKGGHLQTWGSQSSYLLYVVTYSARKWGAIKRKAQALGWQLMQDGDDEGCFRLSLPDEAQSRLLRELLGLRRKRQPSSAEIVNNEGVSAP